ncbi:MAG: N-acetylmuramoyl-L-alanine amidase, partial [Clostridiales bacterium]|nr:N-acetylmuramoyl-L-alanine amidase [Clostridiales bacterium]
GGSRWDELKLSVENSTAITTKAVAAVCTRADFDGSVLKLTLASVSTDKAAPVAALPESSPFSGMTVERSGNKAVYSLSLKDGESCDGYYVERVSDGIVLHIKRHISNTPSIYEAAATGSSGRPLSGITIMVDPGHGGSDSGAIGPTGMVYPEKTINLATALKLKDELENLGASVLMTRTTDTTVSLNERLAASRKAKPDLFISIHANSMEDNIDISKYKGFSSYFREDLSKQLATLVYDNVTASLGRYKNGVHDNNFFVITATWTPSILIESGFVPNPSEHEWLINKESQALLAKSLAKSIAAYFN